MSERIEELEKKTKPKLNKKTQTCFKWHIGA